MDILLIIFKTIYLLLPAYFANMAPVFAKGHLKSLEVPIDFRKTWKGKRIFGEHKTWRGLFVGTIIGIIIAGIQYIIQLQDYSFIKEISALNYSNWLMIGILLGAGAIIGDTVKSFFKRRIGIKPGKTWLFFDQVDFVIGALVFILPFYTGILIEWIFAIIISFLLHVIVVYMGYLLGIREDKI